MTKIALSLIVIRSRKIEELKDFYQKLGLVFQQEQHGKGPIHYSTLLGDIVFEIYPLYKEEPPTMNRIGFLVANLKKVFDDAKTGGVTIISEPKMTPWGYVALVKDPEGRTIELTQKPN